MRHKRCRIFDDAVATASAAARENVGEFILYFDILRAVGLEENDAFSIRILKRQV